MRNEVSTSKGNFIIRPYLQQDEDGVLSLWKASFGSDMEKGIWRWKYMNNTCGNQLMLCVHEGGEIVAMYGGVCYRALWEGREILITHLMDNMSHPAYRGVLGGRSGLFVRTASAFYDNYGGSKGSIFFYGFPGSRHFYLGKYTLNYDSFSDGMAFFRSPVKNISTKSRPFSGKTDLIDPDERLFDQLINRCRKSFPFAVIRDSEFVRWRFCEHPGNKYEIWGQRSFFSRELKGYAVVSIEGDTARLVDIFFAPSNRTVQAFLGNLGAELGARGIEAIETWLPKNHFLAEAVISSGFLPFPEPLGIIPGGRTFDPKLMLKWISDNIFYTMADGDLF
ncbi:MAG: GNAT family N-acetyltransferase [Deltaproteobacteria bacterium]|nr:GNAT family N-acetyltransferase [Deltaproteobacteria bacterium]